jgi:hypothetical protein
VCFCAQNIIALYVQTDQFESCSNPSLRVAYIDEVLKDSNKVQKVFYSVLVKAQQDHDQVVIYL